MVVHEHFSDFALFLYIFMAHADGDFHPAEKDAILKKMEKLYPGEPDLASRLATAIASYEKIDPRQHHILIRETFRHFSQVKFNQRYKVYTDMFDIINADGKVHEAETRALEALRNVINAGNEKAE